MKCCLVNGLEIVGFKVLNAKGEIKDLSYAKTITLAKQKKIDGIKVKRVEGKDVFVNLDFMNIEKLPVQVMTSYRLEEEDGKVKSYVTFDGEEEKEVALGEFWNAYIGNYVNKADKEKLKCGLQLEGTSYVKAVCE